jgi:hypothetical protein
MMKTRTWSFAAVVLFAVVSLGCPSSGNLSKTESGGVYLSITDFNGLPAEVSVSQILSEGGGVLTIEELTVASIVVNQVQPTSSLMNVELERYEVGFSRADQGTRVPQPTVRGIFGTVPPDGETDYENLRLMTSEEFTNPPLRDLLPQFGGVDSETGSAAILLNLELKFFGQTLNGTKVETRVPARFTVQFVP